jgi:hypothetical protein
MKFFRRLSSSINVAPLLAEIQANEDAWLHNTSRQDNIAVQRHTNTIFIRSFPENSNGRSRMPWRLSIRRKQHSLLASLGQ